MAGAKCGPVRPIPVNTGFHIILLDANGIFGPGELPARVGGKYRGISHPDSPFEGPLQDIFHIY